MDPIEMYTHLPVLGLFCINEHRKSRVKYKDITLTA